MPENDAFAAAIAASLRGGGTLLTLGNGGSAMGRAAEIHVNVPSASTPRARDAHRTGLHVPCDLVERAFVA